MYGPLVERALATALLAHAGQERKGGGVPYIVHPLHVGLIVAQWGGDEEAIAAAILHDVVEDCEEWSLATIEQEFGSVVAEVVRELTEDKAHTWEERKEHAIRSVPELSERACMVKAADKLHNLCSLAGALAEEPDSGAVWSRFNGGRERTIAKDRRMVDALSQRVPGAEAELRRALAAVEAAA